MLTNSLISAQAAMGIRNVRKYAIRFGSKRERRQTEYLKTEVDANSKNLSNTMDCEQQERRAL
jgi:hypothetical protein